MAVCVCYLVCVCCVCGIFVCMCLLSLLTQITKSWQRRSRGSSRSTTSLAGCDCASSEIRTISDINLKNNKLSNIKSKMATYHSPERLVQPNSAWLCWNLSQNKISSKHIPPNLNLKKQHRSHPRGSSSQTAPGKRKWRQAGSEAPRSSCVFFVACVCVCACVL